MPLNVDLHTHSFFSGDGISSPEDLIAAARAKGLSGIAITDHNTCDAVNYLLEKGLMRLDGLPVNDFLILPGVEVTTADGHLLCIGAELPYLKGKPAREVCDIIHERGGLAIPPHPYDLFRAGIRFATLETLPVDALEVFNAATTLRRYNRYAFKYAQIRGLPMTAASDAHHAAAVGTSLHDRQHGRFFGERNSRPDRQKQRIESEIPNPARQFAQNVEQLVATSPPTENSRARRKRPDSQRRLNLTFRLSTFSSHARLYYC